MRPASRNPKSAQTRPHVKPLKPNKHTPKKEKKKKKSQQGGHFEDLKGYKKIPKQQQQKGQKIWLSHVQVSLPKGNLKLALQKKAMQNKPTLKIPPFKFKHS